MRKLVAAIDLGTSKVVCLVGEKTDAGIKIIAMSEAPTKGISRGEVINIQSALDSMMPTIRNVENAIGEQINDVFIGIAGQGIKCIQGTNQTTRVNPDEYITPEEIEQITEAMYTNFSTDGDEVIHAVPQSYNIDDFMGNNEPVGMIGKQIYSNFKLFTGKKTSSQLRKNVLSRAGLNVSGTYLGPFASAMAVLGEDEKEVGVALLDIGAGTTDLIIIHENAIRYAAVIPFGGNCITEDVKQGCGVSSRVAEQLKVERGSCMSSTAPDKQVKIPGIGGREDKYIHVKNLAEIIESRVEEIIEAAMYEIEKSGYRDKITAGLVITGGSSYLANLQPFVKFITGMDAKLAYPMRTLSEVDVNINRPSISTAVGLVIMGFAELEKMEKKGRAFRTTTPSPAKKEAASGFVKDEKNELPAKDEPKEAAKKSPSWGEKLSGFFGAIKSDNVFNDNEA
ncbi:MAG: cell division protein FtsA [Bacteroidales bacterium]|nr:cell division protein FtsA [Bacteroidales bacterium]